MVKINRKFLYSVAVLIGTMIGVGIFGIPFAFSKAGFFISLGFLVTITAITLIIDLIYGEIILRTEGDHQVVGYVDIYLGSVYKRIIFFAVTLSIYAALLAYIIISGEFLTTVFSSIFYVSPTSFSIWFFIVASILIYAGLKTVSWIELGLSLMFISIIIIIFGFGVSEVNFSNYLYTNTQMWFFPYGVFLFAFAGLAAIPIQRQLLKGQEKYLKKSIYTAVGLTAILYFIFGATILGISGDTTSPDAINGLVGYLGENIIFLGSLFGLIAVGTSYLMLGSALIDVFFLDYKINRKIAWFFVVSPPFILFFGGLRNFIDVISIAGSVAVGIEAAILIMVFIKAKKMGRRGPEYSLSLPRWSLYGLASLFIAGVLYALFLF